MVDAEVLKQVRLIQECKEQLDKIFGENTYPVELITSVHEWVNKWRMSQYIQEKRQQNGERKPTEKMIHVLKKLQDEGKLSKDVNIDRLTFEEARKYLDMLLGGT